MAQDLKTVVADINADIALFGQPELPPDQLLKVIDKLYDRDLRLVQKATQTLGQCLSQLKEGRAQLQRAQLQQQLEAERAQSQQSFAQWAYNILTSMLAWGQTTDLAKLDKQIRELENLLSSIPSAE
jgi:hypothetical protein